MIGTLRNVTAGIDLDAKVARATSPFERMWGLLGARSVAADEGIWLDKCSAIHTIGMRATIDVIFLDRHGAVVACRPQIRPNRMCISQRGSHAIIEMGAGFLAGKTIALGDRLALIERTGCEKGGS